MDARIPLSRLAPGEEGVIAAVDAPEGLRHRLAALGLRAGRAVRLLRRARMGGPLHVRVGMTDVALRRDEASGISLRPAAPPSR